jgi:hypothetical protein
MSDKPKRRFWQLHLSTAVLMMFIASGVVGANVRRYELHIEEYPLNGYGWPFVLYWNTNGYETETGQPMHQFDWVSLAANVCILIIILVSTGILFEWRICRREARKQ